MILEYDHGQPDKFDVGKTWDDMRTLFWTAKLQANWDKRRIMKVVLTYDEYTHLLYDGKDYRRAEHRETFMWVPLEVKA